MEILHQLADLFLEAAPTVVIVFFFYLFLRWAFFTPIQKAMAERSAQIEGARAEAAAAEGAGARDLDAYNDAMKKALGEIYVEQETKRQAILDDRAKLLKAMRTRAQEDVVTAKKKIAEDLVAARGEVERETASLAGKIARSILENPSPMRGGSAR